jgi:hypothetical protein
LGRKKGFVHLLEMDRFILEDFLAIANAMEIERTAIPILAAPACPAG